MYCILNSLIHARSKAEEKGMAIEGLRDDIVSFVFNEVLIGTMEPIAA